MSDSTTQPRPNLVVRILNWLRAGYPDGIPATDHVALMGLLHRTLTETEVGDIAAALEQSDSDDLITRDEVAKAIHDHALEKASDKDIDRVCVRLAEAGFGIARDRGADAAARS